MDGMMKGSYADVGFDMTASINKLSHETVLRGEFIETIGQPASWDASIFGKQARSDGNVAHAIFKKSRSAGMTEIGGKSRHDPTPLPNP